MDACFDDLKYFDSDVIDLKAAVVNGEAQSGAKRKRDEPEQARPAIDRHRVKMAKQCAKGMGMKAENKDPYYSAAVRKQASELAPKDVEGGDARSCILHGFEVYGGSRRNQSHSC
jgi:hypothetical protein